ncbi:SRPBCC family protein [Dactylosporangium sp. McL0621]|uniref:SRPBCC family protein n=1 Tax=Dactylosporangium sp. McL0621 TaxID=3415678 RepID=UPI003CF34186
MTDRTVLHAAHTLERTYPRPPARVFAAWSDPASKARWFGGDRHELDFRAGGHETVHGRDTEGRALRHEARYEEIVPNERIVYTSTLSSDGVPVTISVTTVQFRPAGEGTALVLTEQAAYLDDREQPAWRERGTGDWLDALGRELA